MASRYAFEIATQAEDPALRRILRSTTMPGQISLRLEREPNFWLAERAGNTASQVIACRNFADEGIVGFGVRALRPAFVNGQRQEVGYLSGLRSLPTARNIGLLARGFRFLQVLDGNQRAALYYTTIMDDNDQARTLLTSERAGLPRYQPLATLTTYMLPLYQKLRKQSGRSRSAIPEEAQLLAETVSQYNRQFQLAPVWTSADLIGATDKLPDFQLQNLSYIQGTSGPTATLGVWNQSGFKQIVVADYEPPLRWLQPLTRFSGGLLPPLPAIGTGMPLLYGFLASHAPDHESDFDQLLEETLTKWSGQGFAYLLLGLHEQHPLTPIVARRAVRTLHSTTYVVSWGETPRLDATLVPHLEIATL